MSIAYSLLRLMHHEHEKQYTHHNALLWQYPEQSIPLILYQEHLLKLLKNVMLQSQPLPRYF
jgi:hypothetical protein